MSVFFPRLLPISDAVRCHLKTMTQRQAAAGISIFPFEEGMAQMTDANRNSRRGNYSKRNFSECYSEEAQTPFSNGSSKADDGDDVQKNGY